MNNSQLLLTFMSQLSFIRLAPCDRVDFGVSHLKAASKSVNK